MQLPDDLLDFTLSFLDYKEQTLVARLNTTFCKFVRHLDAKYKAETLILSGLTGSPLLNLATSLAVGHPIYWVPHMHAWWDNLFGGNVDEIVAEFAILSTLSLSQCAKFCKYFCKLSRDIRPWIAYQILKQFASEEVVEAYMTQRAETRLHVYCENSRVQYQLLDIDPRDWFGFNDLETSLTNGVLPDLIVRVLWQRIQSLQTKTIPFQVSMIGRCEAQLPRNFTLKLARLITNAGIFLDCNASVDADLLDAKYARPLFSLDL